VTAITATRPRATKDILVSIGIAFVLTAVSYILGLHLNWIEVIAVFTSYMATWLCVVERRFNYPMGIISSAFYAWLFIDANLVASRSSISTWSSTSSTVTPDGARTRRPGLFSG
jgi:hypothetical protein